jgi:hypothetical protein
MAFSASIACEAGKALVDISLAFLVAAALVIVNIRVCLPSRDLAAADEPKPEETAAKEGKRGRLANRGLGECKGVYLVICHGITALVVRIVVGIAVAPNVAFCARNREQDAPRVKNRGKPRIYNVVVDERAEWGDGRPPRIKGKSSRRLIGLPSMVPVSAVMSKPLPSGAPAVSVPDPVSVPESVQS